MLKFAMAVVLAASAAGQGATTAPLAPSAKALIADQLAALDRDLGAKMLKRAAAGEVAGSRLEIEIDLRVLARWAMAAAREAEGDAQAAAWLRANQFVEAIAACESLLDRAGNLSAAQQAALAKLHDYTYSLADGATAKDLDGAAARLAATLAGLAPGGGDSKSLPAMRPKFASTRGSGWTALKGGPAGLTEAAGKLHVSAPLRQQIELLSQQVERAAADSARASDLAAALAALAQVVELGRALEVNVSISTESRPQLEAQLAEGIALFLDPRTRAGGAARIEALQQYRSIVGRFVSLNIPDAQRARLAPVFAWAHANPEAGVKALAAIERFGAMRQRFDGRPRQPSTVAPLRKPIEDLEKIFETAAAAFIAKAADLPKPDGTVTSADLDKPLDDLRRSIDVLERLDQMPRTLDIINGYKPRPFGGIDRRVALAAGALGAANAKSAEAAKFFDDLARVAGVASDLAAIKVSGLGAEIDRAYAGGQLVALDGRWKALISEVINSAANGAEIDAAKLARAASARPLLQALQQAGRVEMLAQNPGALSRWVDWRVSSDDLRSILTAYGATLSEAVVEYTGEKPAAEKMIKALPRHRPVMVLIERVGACRDQCAALPTSPNGLIASLQTPFDGAPFAIERYASLCAAVRARCLASQDEAGAAEVLALLNKRISRDLKLD